jgi:hypothetical protein
MRHVARGWIVALALLLFAAPAAAPAAAQAADTLTMADRASIVARVLQARRGELHDAVDVDTASLTRVLGTSVARVPAVAPLLSAPCDTRGRWTILAWSARRTATSSSVRTGWSPAERRGRKAIACGAPALPRARADGGWWTSACTISRATTSSR